MAIQNSIHIVFFISFEMESIGIKKWIVDDDDDDDDQIFQPNSD